MQQRFLLRILLLAQHVSDITMPIIRSSRVLYSGCCLWYFVLWFSSCWSGVELRVTCPVCRMLAGLVVPETCWASNKIRNKKPLLHLVGILFPQICSYSELCRSYLILRALPPEGKNIQLPPLFFRTVK